MVGELAGGRDDLDVVDPAVVQHLLRDLGTGEADRHLRVFTEAALQHRTDEPAQEHGATGEDEVDGIEGGNGGGEVLGQDNHGSGSKRTGILGTVTTP